MKAPDSQTKESSPKGQKAPTPRQPLCPRLHTRPESLLARIERRERKSRIRMMKRQEYRRLRAMVPSIASKPRVSKVTVIEEAIRYIDHLHSALISRLRSRGLPQCLQGANVDVNQLGQQEIRELVRHLVTNPNNSNPSSNSNQPQTPPTRDQSTCLVQPSPSNARERARQVPSYLLRLQQKRRP